MLYLRGAFSTDSKIQELTPIPVKLGMVRYRSTGK